MTRGQSWCLILGAILFLCDAVAASDRVSFVNLPTKRLGQVGFVLNVQVATMGRGGYRPVYLNFTSLTGTFPADRTVEVVVSPRHHPHLTMEFDASQRITLPQGARTVTAQMNVPVYYPWEWCRVRIEEEGREIPNCDSGPISTNAEVNAGMPAWSNVGVVIPSDFETGTAPWQRVPDIRTLNVAIGMGALPEDTDKPRLDNDEAIAALNGTQNSWVKFRNLYEEELPHSWLGFSQLDVILIAAPVWQRIENKQPQVANALQDWLAMGGNLWLYASEAAAESPLLANARAVQPKQIISAKALEHTLPMSGINTGPEVWGYGYSNYGVSQTRSSNRTRKKVFDELKSNEHPFVLSYSPEELAQKIRVADLCLGRVVAISDPDPFPGSHQLWRNVIAVNAPPRLTWHVRNGFDVTEGTGDYWGLLISAVGRPPVVAFLVLITGFVMTIGPLAYFLLNRLKRLHFLFFVAPLGAAVVTISLFVYGVLADGLGTKVRARQLTVLDGASGYGAEFQRQTYFAGSTLRRGLVFDADAAVFPIMDDPYRNAVYGHYGGDNETRSRIYLSAEQQRLTGGLISPRTQAQYAVMHPEAQLGRLELVREDDGVKVLNRLPFNLTKLLVRDGGGSYLACDEPLAAQAAMTLVPLDPEQADSWLLARRDEVAFEIPEIYTSISSTDLFGVGYRYGRSSAPVAKIMPYKETPVRGLFEHELHRLTTLDKPLEKGTFFAVAEVTTRHLAEEDAELNDGVHIVMGTLP